MFYEIFKFLEENVSDQILPLEYHRAAEFEKDLEFYKGCDWEKTYKIRESVQNYLNHLNKINKRNPLLLIAYVYHLYMGLLSGGQILAKKRNIAIQFKKSFSEQREDKNVIQPGNHLTSFPDKSVFEMKNNLRNRIDEFTKNFDEKLRQELIEESKKVFELNNTIINTVEGVGAQLRKNLRNVFFYLVLTVLSGYVFLKMLKV